MGFSKEKKEVIKKNFLRALNLCKTPQQLVSVIAGKGISFVLQDYAGEIIDKCKEIEDINDSIGA